MGDVTQGGLTVDQRTKKLMIRRKELEIENLGYQSKVALLRADELGVEIIRQQEQAESNGQRIISIREEIDKMRGVDNG